MSQRDQILAHLRGGEAITAYTALTQFGCLRLAARIAELRECGYAIQTVKLGVGKKIVAMYSMLEEAPHGER